MLQVRRNLTKINVWRKRALLPLIILRHGADRSIGPDRIDRRERFGSDSEGSSHLKNTWVDGFL